jgi:hypothetical protein
VGWRLSAAATGGSVLEQDRLVRQMTGGLKIDEPTVLAAFDELITLGLTTTPGDLARVELTKAGDALFHRLRSGIDRITERLYAYLPVDDLVTARRVLAIVTERANAELAQ